MTNFAVVSTFLSKKLWFHFNINHLFLIVRYIVQKEAKGRKRRWCLKKGIKPRVFWQINGSLFQIKKRIGIMDSRLRTTKHVSVDIMDSFFSLSKNAQPYCLESSLGLCKKNLYYILFPNVECYLSCYLKH